MLLINRYVIGSIPVPVWAGAPNAPEWRPTRRRTLWGLELYPSSDSALKLVQWQESEYPSRPPPAPTWSATGPGWTGPHWERRPMSHPAPTSGKHHSCPCWFDYWFCLMYTYRETLYCFMQHFAVHKMEHLSQRDELWKHGYLCDFTWLVKRNVRVQDLRNQDLRFLHPFLGLASPGPETLNRHCGVQSWKKVRWVDNIFLLWRLKEILSRISFSSSSYLLEPMLSLMCRGSQDHYPCLPAWSWLSVAVPAYLETAPSFSEHCSCKEKYYKRVLWCQQTHVLYSLPKGGNTSQFNCFAGTIFHRHYLRITS